MNAYAEIAKHHMVEIILAICAMAVITVALVLAEHTQPPLSAHAQEAAYLYAGAPSSPDHPMLSAEMTTGRVY